MTRYCKLLLLLVMVELCEADDYSILFGIYLSCLQKLLMIAKSRISMLSATSAEDSTPKTSNNSSSSESALCASYVQSSTRGIVRLCLKTIPSHLRGVVDRLRASLALDSTPVFKYLPRTAVEDVVARLLTHASPAQYVSDVLLSVQSATTHPSSNQSQTKADAVKALLGLAVVCTN